MGKLLVYIYIDIPQRMATMFKWHAGVPVQRMLKNQGCPEVRELDMTTPPPPIDIPSWSTGGLNVVSGGRSYRFVYGFLGRLAVFKI